MQIRVFHFQLNCQQLFVAFLYWLESSLLDVLSTFGSLSWSYVAFFKQSYHQFDCYHYYHLHHHWQHHLHNLPPLVATLASIIAFPISLPPFSPSCASLHSSLPEFAIHFHPFRRSIHPFLTHAHSLPLCHHHHHHHHHYSSSFSIICLSFYYAIRVCVLCVSSFKSLPLIIFYYFLIIVVSTSFLPFTCFSFLLRPTSSSSSTLPSSSVTFCCPYLFLLLWLPLFSQIVYLLFFSSSSLFSARFLAPLFKLSFLFKFVTGFHGFRSQTEVSIWCVCSPASEQFNTRPSVDPVEPCFTTTPTYHCQESSPPSHWRVFCPAADPFIPNDWTPPSSFDLTDSFSANTQNPIGLKLFTLRFDLHNTSAVGESVHLLFNLLDWPPSYICLKINQMDSFIFEGQCKNDFHSFDVLIHFFLLNCPSAARLTKCNQTY